MEILQIPISDIVEYENNPRLNDRAVGPVAKSIEEFGFKVPILLDKDNVIIAGHTRLKAARELGLDTVPCIMCDDLTPAQVKAFRLADNKVAEFSGWDYKKLELETAELTALLGDKLDLGEFGFDVDDNTDFGGLLKDPEEEDGGDGDEEDDADGMVQCPYCGEWFKP